jgi:hypothetical protein
MLILHGPQKSKIGRQLKEIRPGHFSEDQCCKSHGIEQLWIPFLAGCHSLDSSPQSNLELAFANGLAAVTIQLLHVFPAEKELLLVRHCKV